ncbi:MAG: radical SAM protein [Planctomycetes bacterium]|nr:radical SAM protein [Planctomycetota bacterium]
MPAPTTTEMQQRLQPLQALQGRQSTHLLLYETYLSIQGESSHAGRPCVFVRTAVCNQRCSYCDTAYAFTGGKLVPLESALDQVLAFATPLVEITGGEPLLQPAIVELCKRLLAAGCEVLMETGGSRDISVLPVGVKRIVDVKTPGSGEDHANMYENLDRLRPGDEVKFVLTSRADYEWARDLLRRLKLAEITTVLFSPAWKLVDPADLAGWINTDRLPVRLNLQLHKYIWHPAKRGV